VFEKKKNSKKIYLTIFALKNAYTVLKNEIFS
jgi:hypothetical protein